MKPMTLQAVAEVVGGTVEGDPTAVVEAIASVEEAGPGELTFAIDQKRAVMLPESRATGAIVSRSGASGSMALIVVADVGAAMADLLACLAEPEDLPPAGIDPRATVAQDARLAEGVAVGPGVVIGLGATIGQGTALCANVSIARGVTIGRQCVLAEGVVVKPRCRLGDRVRIGPNSVIGTDGFGYRTADGVHYKLPHIGDVVIEDDVELGACTCVDRGKFASTVVGAGTKVDNLVQIAHNVRIGKGCMISGQAGIAGSARLGNDVVLGGNAGIRDNIKVGDGVQCAAFAAVSADVPSGQAIAGIPARPFTEALRIFQATAKLPELLKRVRKLEARFGNLESAENNQEAHDG